MAELREHREVAFGVEAVPVDNRFCRWDPEHPGFRITWLSICPMDGKLSQFQRPPLFSIEGRQEQLNLWLRSDRADLDVAKSDVKQGIQCVTIFIEPSGHSYRIAKLFTPQLCGRRSKVEISVLEEKKKD